jgi:uncharacterized protein YgfB (UPF0149 family)
MNYQEFNVTRWLPSLPELVEMYNQRRGKSSKTRFVNECLKESKETRQDLADALATSCNGMLHGATHTRQDLNKLDQHINNILKLKHL